MAFSWIVYCIIIGLIIGLTSIAILFRKKTRAQDNSSTQQKYLFSKKILPISRSKGWQLLSISHGIRIWKRNENDHKAWIPNAIYGSYMIISASVKDIMETVRNPSLLQEWDATIEHVSQVTLEDDSDVLSVKPQKNGVLWKIACWFGKTWDEDINIVTSRYWQSTEDKEGWSFWLSREHNMFYNSMGWSCFTVTKLDNDKNIPKCMVSVIACPSSCDHETIYQSTSAKLAALKDYFKCFHLHPVHLEDEVETSSGIGDTDDSSNKSVSKSEVKQLTERTESKQEKQPGIQPEKKSYETRYQNEIEQATKSLMSSYEAADGDDHWVLVGNIKGVHILKRPAQPGERPWECFKGTTTINVPVNYILAYAFSLDHRGEYDDMYNRGEVIEEMNPLTKVNRMEFKPVWPSTARDFCNFGAVLDLGEGLYGVVSQSVEHDNCPAKKGFVRAELLFAGFVVKEESSDPPSCQVSYISKADLKGNLPVRIVNRVAQSQPQNLAIFRSKLEERYTNDMRIPAEDKSPFHKSAQDLWKELMKVRELKCKNTTSLEDKDSAVAESDTSDLLTGEGSSLSGKSEGGQNDSDFEDSFNTLEVTDENLKLPLMDRQIDYRTLGNQAAATLLGELVLASRVEISLAVTDNLPQEEKEGEWGFHMVEKDVIILKKVSSGEKIHSYLGKGLIKVSPLTVWQAVTNHMTRHLYDKTLKKIKLVKRIDEQTKILYQHHEAAQCFVKQARDFVILIAERVESERYVSAGVSVDYPDCPPQKNLVRGKILSAGWVIEPALQNGQLHSMVSYMCQINFGGSVPVRLLNYVGKRQPLCIAYLREYLENGDERWH